MEQDYSGLYNLPFQCKIHGPCLKLVVSGRETEQGLQLQTKEKELLFFPISPAMRRAAESCTINAPQTIHLLPVQHSA